MSNQTSLSEGELHTRPPSVVYEEAKRTLVYTLSELVFGSLLASFILGFVAFSISTLQIGIDIETKFIKVGTYLLISGVFTYFTAGLYLMYHTGILTMPTFNFKSARRDFSLSILSAVAFGISMLAPELLMLCLSLIIFRALQIQHIEQKKLIDILYDKHVTRSTTNNNERKEADYVKGKHKEIKKLINTSKLDGWKYSRISWTLNSILFVIGIASIKIALNNFTKFSFFNCEISYDLALLIFCGILFFAIYLKLKSVFDLATSFLDKETEKAERNLYDSAYSELIESIKKLQ